MTFNITGWIFGFMVLAIAVSNFLWVHPVPASVFLLLSLIYFPPVNMLLKTRFGLAIPLVFKIILGIIIIWFTLGVSDLGDMIDKL